MNPLREGGRFATETYSIVKIEGYNSRHINWRVVYADRCEPSHCSWMVPGTYEPWVAS